jgi:hypothetical protein
MPIAVNVKPLIPGIAPNYPFQTPLLDQATIRTSD